MGPDLDYLQIIIMSSSRSLVAKEIEGFVYKNEFFNVPYSLIYFVASGFAIHELFWLMEAI